MEEKERRASEPRLSLAQKMEVLRLHDSKEYSYRKIAASFDVQLKSIQNIVRNRVSIEEKARSATQEELLAIPPLSPYEAMETRLRAWIGRWVGHRAGIDRVLSDHSVVCVKLLAITHRDAGSHAVGPGHV